ncbi:MAG: tetratricopeptide repeat protein [Bacteroidales bacterium]|nr:tetratricopeptide repeat protein [Bacteroidales bacterium]
MKHRLLISFVVLIISTVCLFAQKANDEPVDPRGDAYFKANCFTRALDEYIKAYAKNPNKASLMRRIAECVMETEVSRDTALAFIEPYLGQAPTDADAVYMSAQAYFHAHQFDSARARIDRYKTLVPQNANSLRVRKFENAITNAERMVAKPMKNRIVNMGEMINTSASEFTPYILNDNTLIFSCDEKYSPEAKLNIFNLKYSDNDGLSWSQAKSVSGQINTVYDEYVCGAQGNHVFFNSNRTTQFSIWETDYRGNGRFTDGVKLGEPIDGVGDEVAATLSPSGDTIIFSATTAKGDLDLYYCIKVNGSWGPARMLPGELNKPDSDENYPNLTSDGRLYFCSDREGSMGGYDIFYSDYDVSKGIWSSPQQMGYPINDTYDNTTISFTSNGRYAYISNIRKDGFGARDIYAVIFDDAPAATVVLKCFVGIDAKPAPKPLEESPLIKVMNNHGELVATAALNMRTSTFILALEPGIYTITIDAEGAELYENKITIEEQTYEHDAMERVILLKPEI